MATKIEWTNETWNPVSGCTRVSAGCDNCYAVGQTHHCENMGQEKYAGLTVLDKHGRRRFKGVVRCHESALAKPLRWKKGRMVFVNSMSDLFHKDVPLEFVNKVFDVIRRCPQHVFQVLTKRPERVAELDDDLDWPGNLWMGVTVENGDVAHRIDLLRDECRAKVKWLSIEPLIGPMPDLSLVGIDWVVVGGESGSRGRPLRKDWIDDIRERCVSLGIPFFFKQWGRLRNNPDPNDPTAKRNGGTAKGGKRIDGRVCQEFPKARGQARHVHPARQMQGAGRADGQGEVRQVRRGDGARGRPERGRAPGMPAHAVQGMRERAGRSGKANGRAPASSRGNGMDGKKVEIEELVDGDRVYGAMAAARAVGVLKVQCAQCGMVVEPQMHWDGQELLIYTYCLMPTRFVRVRAAYPASCRASLEDLKLRVDAALEMIEDGKAGGIVDSDRVYDAYRALVRAGLWESAAELDALVESDWPDFDDLMMGSRDEVDEGS